MNGLGSGFTISRSERKKDVDDRKRSVCGEIPDYVAYG